LQNNVVPKNLLDGKNRNYGGRHSSHSIPKPINRTVRFPGIRGISREKKLHPIDMDLILLDFIPTFM